MKITKRQLKRIIKEEEQRLVENKVRSIVRTLLLSEQSLPEPDSIDQALEWLGARAGDPLSDPRADSQNFSVIEKAFPEEAAALKAGSVPASARDKNSPFRELWDQTAERIADRESDYVWARLALWFDGRSEEAFEAYYDEMAKPAPKGKEFDAFDRMDVGHPDAKERLNTLKNLVTKIAAEEARLNGPPVDRDDYLERRREYDKIVTALEDYSELIHTTSDDLWTAHKPDADKAAASGSSAFKEITRTRFTQLSRNTIYNVLANFQGYEGRDAFGEYY